MDYDKPSPDQFREFLARGGERAADKLTRMGKFERLLVSFDSPVGRHFQTYLSVRLDSLFVKIFVEEKGDELDRAEFRVLKDYVTGMHRDFKAFLIEMEKIKIGSAKTNKEVA
jgi:hypothetical protein